MAGSGRTEPPVQHNDDIAATVIINALSIQNLVISGMSKLWAQSLENSATLHPRFSPRERLLAPINPLGRPERSP
jgi:hypothetical protein